MTGDYLDRLARLARRVRFDELSASTVRAAKAVVLDTLGAILAGSRLDENAKLADLAAERSGHRTATLIGRARKVEPMFAALANATAGVALEMDEGNRWGGDCTPRTWWCGAGPGGAASWPPWPRRRAAASRPRWIPETGR